MANFKSGKKIKELRPDKNRPKLALPQSGLREEISLMFPSYPTFHHTHVIRRVYTSSVTTGCNL